MSEGLGHNSIDNTMLASYVERVEDRERDKRAASEDIAEICAEAKSNGLEPSEIRRIVRERLMTDQQRAKKDRQEAILDLYRHALSMRG